MRPAIKQNIMSKYIDADKLIAEIERRQKIVEPHKDTFESAAACRQELIWMKEFVASLLQEQPQVADASKMERLNVDILRDWSMKFAPDIRDAIKATAYHFWDLAIYSRKEK